MIGGLRVLHCLPPKTTQKFKGGFPRRNRIIPYQIAQNLGDDIETLHGIILSFGVYFQNVTKYGMVRQEDIGRPWEQI